MTRWWAAAPGRSGLDRALFDGDGLHDVAAGRGEHGIHPRDDDPEEVERARQDDIRRSANDLLLVERAREWLLDDAP